jgi:hypothetical protein
MRYQTRRVPKPFLALQTLRPIEHGNQIADRSFCLYDTDHPAKRGGCNEDGGLVVRRSRVDDVRPD